MRLNVLLLSVVFFGGGCTKSVPPHEQLAFIENVFGGKDAYHTINSPDHAEAWLLVTPRTSQEIQNRSGPVKLKPETAKTFSQILLNFDSYFPPVGVGKACAPDFGVRLQFTKGTNDVEILFCFDCDILEVTHNGQWQADFDPSHNGLVKAIQTVFPQDKIIQELELRKQR